ncbi:MAG: transposase family protein [Lentimicrobiaceae bacterium]|nr:transposase family protein [Lentimicrobiaceae bacterium]
MYQIIGENICLTVNDWVNAGLTYNQYRNDLDDGYLKYYRRGIHGNTLIDVKSIRRPERMRMIESMYGQISKTDSTTGHRVELDPMALSFFCSYRYDSDKSLPIEKQQQYYNEASILNTLKSIFDKQRIARARTGKRIRMNEWWKSCIDFCKKQQAEFPHCLPDNVRRFEWKYKKFFAEGYISLIHKNYGFAYAEKLTEKAKDWLIARYACPVDKCTLMQLFFEYNEKAKSGVWNELKSEQTIRLFLEKPEIKPYWYGSRYGELKAKEKYTRQHKTLLPTMRDALWYGDGTKLNYFYLNGKEMATCNVYEVIDVYSECLLGFHISDTEDFVAQYQAYKMAMYFSGHKPYEIRFDNQGGHKKLQSGTFFKGLARLAINTQPYNGRSKTIESVFGRFQAEFLHKDWFFTGMNITAKKQESKANLEFILSNKTQLPTLSEVKKIYEKRREEWNNALHFSTGKKRIDMYRESQNPQSPKVEFYDMISMFGVINKTPIKYRSNGIVLTINKQKYQYEVMTIEGQPDFDFIRKNIDRSFHIGYDPEDMTTVSLYEKTPSGDYRFVTNAQKYIHIHRDKQSQDDLDHAFIAAMDKKNKELRVSMQEATEQLLEYHNMHPSQHGLKMPKLQGINKTRRETIGKAMKRESELVFANMEEEYYNIV